MRGLIFVVLLLIVMIAIGWVRLSNQDGNPTLQVDTDKMQHDAAQVVEETRQRVGEAVEALEDATPQEDPALVPAAP